MWIEEPRLPFLKFMDTYKNKYNMKSTHRDCIYSLSQELDTNKIVPITVIGEEYDEVGGGHLQVERIM